MLDDRQARTDVVATPNRRGGKDTLHLVSCAYASTGRPVYASQPSPRVYTTCGVCLKGKSTFNLWLDR